MDLGKFYTLIKDIERYEEQEREAKQKLKEFYAELVPNCPHSEAVEYNHGIRGWGSHRRCLICGVWDHGSEGGTPGDEYDYGYPGHPSRSFWANSKVTITKDKKVWEASSKGHRWQVEDGKAVDPYA